MIPDPNTLGTLRVTYTPKKVTPDFWVVLFFGLFFLSFFIFMQSVFIRIQMKNNPADDILRLFVLLVLIGIVLWMLIIPYRARSVRAFVYERGLLYMDKNAVQTSILWSDIQAVECKTCAVTEGQNSDSGSSYRWGLWYIHNIIITRMDGTSLEIHYLLKNILHLGRTIEEETVQYLLPAFLTLYQRNHPVHFGRLTVTRQGMSYGQSNTWTVAWSEIETINIGEKHYPNLVVIKKKGGLFTPKYLVDIPNVEVFKRLLNYITGGNPNDIPPCVFKF